MERTVEIAIYAALAVVGAGILIGFVASMQGPIRQASSMCPETQCATFNVSFCEGDERITCSLDERGCLSETRMPCPGCAEAGGAVTCGP